MQAGEKTYFGISLFGFLFLLSLIMGFGLAEKTAPRWTRFELDNGLVFFTQEDHSTSMVSHHIFVRTGSRHERPGITDISHFIEHLRWGGNPGEEPYEKTLQAIGGSTGGHTFPDFTDYIDSAPGPALEMIIRSGTEFLAGLRTKDSRFHAERDVLLSEDLLASQNPNYAAICHLFSMAFQSHPYKNPVGGWRSDLSSITLQDVQEYFKTYYAPGNVAVFLAGDFDTPRVAALMARYYGTLPRGPAVPEVRTVEPAQDAEKRVRFMAPVSLPSVWVGYHVPGLAHEDVPALQILNSLLCNGRNARLKAELIEKRKVASAVNPAGSESRQWRKDPSLLIIGLALNAGFSAEEGEEALIEEIEKMRSDPIDEDSLKRAVLREITDRSTSIIYPEWQLWFVTSRTEEAGFYHALSGDPDYALKLIEAYKKVTVEDVRRAAGKYLKPSNRSSVLMVPNQEVSMTEENER